MKKSVVTSVIAAALLGTAITTTATYSAQNNSDNAIVQAATVNAVKGDIVRVSNSVHSAAGFYKTPDSVNGQKTRYGAYGSRWTICSVTTDSNGVTWYLLGTDAWVKANDVLVEGKQTSQDVQSVIDLAYKQLGKPYVWGSKGPSSFDCSGLMYYLFKNATGTNIGGWTVPQESAGQQVSIGNLQAGDLIFWGSRGATYHVGLYIGNGKYIHAPQPGQGVQVASISSYFQPSFGVRVL